MIRRYSGQDASQLGAIHNQVYPQSAIDAQSFDDGVKDALAGGGMAWVIGEEQLSGYAVVSPIPGLPELGDLSGCIVPERQRQGLGSRLLQTILEELQDTAYRQVVHCVSSPASPAAHFLRHHDFFVEHEEVLLVLSDLHVLPAPAAVPALSVRTYPRNEAVPLFLGLYEQSFAGLPWYQPFSVSEVKASLRDSRDMLFLSWQDLPVGFAWVDIDPQGTAQIEPLGMHPDYQSQGYGRYLLVATLRELRNRGARQVEIGAWRNNAHALSLYRSLGFRHQRTFTYLAHDVNS